MLALCLVFALIFVQNYLSSPCPSQSNQNYFLVADFSRFSSLGSGYVAEFDVNGTFLGEFIGRERALRTPV